MTWVVVRCPVCRQVLGEVAGDEARLRKACGRGHPKVLVVYEAGVYRLEAPPPARLAPGQLTAAGVPAIL